MKRIKKESEKNVAKNAKKKPEQKTKKKAVEKIEDVNKLVHLLQVHQIELEHQNEELRFAQEELEESRNKYVNLFDFSPIPYFTLDPEGVISELNLIASKMLGVERKKIIGKRFETFIKLNERDIFHLFIKSIFNSSVKQSCELRIVNKQKQEFYVLLEGLKLQDSLENDNNYQVALIDLTEYRNMEDVLKEANEELLNLNATKDKFFSIIAHDLRSPFQSLLGYSEMFATEIETFSHDEIKTFGIKLGDKLNNLFSLLENLLNWSLLQRNVLENKPSDINLREIVNNTIELLKQGASRKNISINNKIKNNTIAYADKIMIRSIFQNLIANAIKFTQPGGKVIISLIEKKELVEVSIKDTGIGIAPANILLLFNPSVYISTNGTAGENGTGLGLNLCKELIEKNGGKIWVESELGNGSKFSFNLHKAV